MFLAGIFILGLLIGSFLNAMALRYDPERFLLAPVWRGRSHCPHCRRALQWLELVPLVSFLLQRGRCRSCKARLSWQYPLAELATGVVFVGIAATISAGQSWILVLWLLIGSLLVLATLIDLRLRLIPNEIVMAIAVIGIAIAALSAPTFGLTTGSFLGPYALIFGFRSSIWLNHLVAAIVGGGFFGCLYVITRGRGIGLGDLKLAAALGIAFGWPDIGLIVLLSFILGTLVLGPSLLLGKLRLKGTVPFGPFLAAAALTVLIWGQPIIHGYFSLFGFI